MIKALIFSYSFSEGDYYCVRVMKIREEIMLFILKEYNRWKTQSLEIYGCLKNMIIGKKTKSVKA